PATHRTLHSFPTRRSSDLFYLYPTYGLDQEGVRADGGRGTPTPPYIYPDGQSRQWTLDYDPDGNGGTGSITVTLDGQAVTLNLEDRKSTRLNSSHVAISYA